MNCPYNPKMIDEISGIELDNPMYEIWHAGYDAALNEYGNKIATLTMQLRVELLKLKRPETASRNQALQMFIRAKKHGNNEYYYLVKNEWVNGKCHQKIVKYIGKNKPSAHLIAEALAPSNTQCPHWSNDNGNDNDTGKKRIKKRRD